MYQKYSPASVQTVSSCREPSLQSEGCLPTYERLRSSVTTKTSPNDIKFFKSIFYNYTKTMHWKSMFCFTGMKTEFLVFLKNYGSA